MQSSPLRIELGITVGADERRREVEVTPRGGHPALLMADRAAGGESLTQLRVQLVTARDADGLVEQDGRPLVGEATAGIPGFCAQRGDERTTVARLACLRDQVSDVRPRRFGVRDHLAVGGNGTYQEVRCLLLFHDVLRLSALVPGGKRLTPSRAGE